MTFDLAGFSAAAADAVALAGKSVVRVDGRNRQSASGIVWSAEGLVVTANHVLERNEGVTVGVEGASDRLSAQVVGRDPATDLALLRVDAAGLTPAQWAQEVRTGAFVWAVARPGRTLQSTLGVVSSVRSAEGSEQGDDAADAIILTDVLMYPGFSGGALVDASGMVLGLNSSVLWRGASAALGAPTVARVVNTLQTHGRMPRAFLGAGLQAVRLGDALANTAGQESGLMVMSVEVDGPAAKVGVTQGDVLLALDGTRVRALADLMQLLQGDRAGASATLRLARGGAVQEMAVTLGTR